MTVFIIAAVTVDGFIGVTSEHLTDWTSQEDKRLFVKLTKEAGVMVMGARTFETIGRALPGRRTIVYTHHPENITAEGVEATAEPPHQLIERLQKEGAAGVAICGGATIYDLFLDEVDELYVTIEPIVLGGGVPLFRQPHGKKLTLIEQSMLNENAVLLHYKVA